MHAIDRFKHIAAQPKFSGWPLVGEYLLAEKIPYFGQVLKYKLQTGNGVEEYASIIRHFGWCVVFGVTEDNNVITLVQWKPGINQASWELLPGGIGKISPETTMDQVLDKTREAYLRETGYGGGIWSYLGHIMIETGKYRGAGPDDHGLPAHMYMATNLRMKTEARNPNENEIMETLLVPLHEFENVIDSHLFTEASAMPCALLALRTLKLLS